jgi:hypothetical protein
VWTRDASECYPSVTPEAFRAELRELGFRVDTALMLTMLCTVRGRIPQGSPVSGDALNLFLWRADQLLSSFCGKFLSYTRSADDSVLSGKNRRLGDHAARLIERALAVRGIRVNEKKRKEHGRQSIFWHQHVHSIRVNNRLGTTISDSHRDTALAMADAYVAACKSVQPNSLEALAYKRSQLQGWLNYCLQAKFSPARHLRRLLDAGDQTIRRKLLRLGLSAYKGKWWLVNRKSRKNEPRRIAQLWRKKLCGSK